MLLETVWWKMSVFILYFVGLWLRLSWFLSSKTSETYFPWTCIPNLSILCLIIWLSSSWAFPPGEQERNLEFFFIFNCLSLSSFLPKKIWRNLICLIDLWSLTFCDIWLKLFNSFWSHQPHFLKEPSFKYYCENMAYFFFNWM